MTKPQTIAIVIGTRPEAIKLAPVINAFRTEQRFRTVVISTAQHTDMLDQALDAFGITPDIDLGVTRASSTIGGFLGSVLEPLGRVFADIKPTVTLVQGDTMTVLAAAQASFFERFPVGHIEAGLRSGDMAHPFPEEATRKLVSVLVTYHFAPTERARQNLMSEGVDPERIWVTGNTVVDALQELRIDQAENETVRGLDFASSRVILVTAHRRENHGQRLRDICSAVKELVRRFPDVEILFPVHRNPEVDGLVRAALRGVERVHLVPPLSYTDCLYALRHAEMVLTDSGGIQEEAPSFHCPVLILRDVTERPEVIEAGAGLLVGTDPHRIIDQVERLLTDEAHYQAMATAPNPFGDGHASERIVKIIAESFERRQKLRAI